MRTIYLPKNVEYAFWDSFSYCDNLENIYFEEDSHLFYVYSGFIYSNKKIKHIRIPKSISLVPTYLSLGGNINIQTVTYCGLAKFPNFTFSRWEHWDELYCPKSIYVMENYPYDNFGGCSNIVRMKQCPIYPPIPCLTVRYNNLGCIQSYLSYIAVILII